MYTESSIQDSRGIMPLNQEHLDLVSGGGVPLAFAGLVASGAIGALSNYVSGGNPYVGAALGVVSGGFLAAGGALWNVSKVAAVTLQGVGTSIGAASTVGGGGTSPRPKNKTVSQ